MSRKIREINSKNQPEPDFSYSNKIRIKIKQLNDIVNRKSNVLPRIYAKANKLNRRLSISNPVINEPDFGSSSSYMMDNMSEKDKEVFLKAYRTRKRSIIVSKYLDEDLQHRFEQVKYSLNPSRRPSIFESTNSSTSGGVQQELIDLSDLIKKRNSIDDASSSINNKVKSPRFGSTLSKDGQFALMKSLEDTIINEIESTYPEFKGKIPRTSTAKYRKSLNESSAGFDSSRSKSSQVSPDIKYGDENFYFSKSEIFAESEHKESITDNELQKRLIMSQHIDSAMEILDKLRLNSKIQENNRKFQNVKRVNYLDTVLLAQRKVLEPIKPKSASSSSSSENQNENEKKLEPIIKYSQWKNTWVRELENF